MDDRQIAVAGDWALASDGIQWILQCRWKDGKWRGQSFVRSTRDILARCMREKGTDNVTAAQLLAGVPHSFDQWKASQACHEQPPCVSLAPETPPSELDAPAPVWQDFPADAVAVEGA